MKYIFIAIILLAAFQWAASADEGSFTYCTNESYSVFYSPLTCKVYLGCGGYLQDLRLIIIDPLTLIQENTFTITGGLQNVIPVDGGYNLLVLVDNVDIDIGDGALFELDATSGQILDEIRFDKCPTDFCIDSDERSAFVVSGLYNQHGKLTKIDLDNFQASNTIDYGNYANEIEITPDGSKVYANNQNRFNSSGSAGFCYKLGVFDTSDLSQIKSIDHMHREPMIRMGSNGYLYMSGVYRWTLESPSFYIYDTNDNDQIIYSRNFGATMTGWISLDADESHVYLASQRKTYFDQELQDYLYEPSNIIIEINLSDYSSREIAFQEGHFWTIAVAEVNSDNRIFCTSNEGPVVYYKDAGL
jgi:DNA-binding beta-propeller fold protein YncE